MPKNLLRRFATGAVFAAGLAAARADWPARVFVPYMYLGADDHFQLTDCDDACGQKFYTLAFIIAGEANHPAWDGRFPLEDNLYTNQIAVIRARGGEVIASFGGEGGKELALVTTNVDELTAQYAAVTDRYHFTWLDFDVEGRALNNQAANRRRNTALARLQASHPGLRFSYTLPVDPNGIPASARKLLADAKAQGVKVYSANVMTMDFGTNFSAGKTMAEVSIASALKAHEQCAAIDPAIRIGLTPDIGVNDVKSEVFTLADARALEAWAVEQPWVASVSFWCSNRDAGNPGRNGNVRNGVTKEPWAYTRIFQAFGTK